MRFPANGILIIAFFGGHSIWRHLPNTSKRNFEWYRKSNMGSVLERCEWETAKDRQASAGGHAKRGEMWAWFEVRSGTDAGLTDRDGRRRRTTHLFDPPSQSIARHDVTKTSLPTSLSLPFPLPPVLMVDFASLTLTSRSELN